VEGIVHRSQGIRPDAMEGGDPGRRQHVWVENLIKNQSGTETRVE
jgi:hypothetical protein